MNEIKQELKEIEEAIKKLNINNTGYSLSKKILCQKRDEIKQEVSMK